MRQRGGREGGRERDRETDREERQSQSQRQRDRKRERYRDRQTETGTQTQTEREIDRQKHTQTQRQTQRDREAVPFLYFIFYFPLQNRRSHNHTCFRYAIFDRTVIAERMVRIHSRKRQHRVMKFATTITFGLWAVDTFGTTGIIGQ